MCDWTGSREASASKNVKIWENRRKFQFGNCENPGGGLDFAKMFELERERVFIEMI